MTRSDSAGYRPVRRGRVRRLAILGTFLVPFVTLVVQACTNRDIVGPGPTGITVTPSAWDARVLDSLHFSASVRGQDGQPLPPGANIKWRSTDRTKLRVDSITGWAHALLPGTDSVIASFEGVADTAVVTISPSVTIDVRQQGTTTTEAGGKATFTVALSAAPTADVTIGLTVSDTTEATLGTVSSLTFTTSDWAAQTVTVTGKDDFVDDDDVAYTVVTAPAVSADANYDGIDPADVQLTNVDNETADVVVSAASGPTTEAGGQATFTMRLASQPLANVRIALASSDTTEGKIAVDSVVFTPATWDVNRIITVTGQNDALADGNVDYWIVAGPTVSTDLKYNGMSPDSVKFTNVDDETPGITVSPPSGPTTEAGGQATFTIVLNAQPTANVTINLASSNPAEGTISAGSVTFTTANWDVPQTVTVTGQDDDVDDGDVQYTIVTAPATSPDPDYAGRDAPDVLMTNIDDDVAGIRVSPISGPTTEAGGTATFTIVLTSRPTGSVTIGLTSSDLTEGTISTSSVTFASSTWNIPQTVTVTGQNDAIADGNVQYTIVTAPATSTDPKYNGMNPPDVSVTNVDDETVGITVSAISGPTTEAGGTATFTVVLNTQPSAPVTVGLSSSNTNEGTISISSLTFNLTGASAWNIPQVVTVTGVDDFVDDDDVSYTIVTAPATSADSDYNGLNPADVVIINIDNDTAGVTVSPISGPTTEAGGTATFTVVLNSRPTADVTIGLTSSNTSEGTVSPASLTFTPANWNLPRTVTVTGQDDLVADGNVIYTIVTAPATSSDPRYSGLNAVDVTVTNVDDEKAGITVSPISGPTTEAGGTAVFTIVLNNQPTADVTIALSSSDLTEGTVSPTSVTFSPSGPNIWSTPRTITVTGVNDDVDDDNVVYTIITAPAVSTDANYNGINAADVSVTNIDDDTAGILVSAVSGPTTEAGGTATFTVVLTSQPTANVTIGLSSSNTNEGTVSPATLTFTPTPGANAWNNPHVVTVTGVDDFIDDDNIVYTIITAPAVSTDTKYNGLNAIDVTVTNVDDEVAGFTVSAPSGPTTEGGGTATFTLVLNTQPTANVTIGLSSSNTNEGTVSPTSLTFTPTAGANAWNNPHVVTVTGVDDLVADGNVVYSIITAPAVSADPKYNGLNPADVSITNTDNDVAGINVSAISGPTTEAGGTATFTVVLTSQPTANVTIGLSSSNTNEGTVSPASLTFTPSGAGIWSTPQTVTVTGVDDFVDDDNIVYTIVTAPAVSADAKYNGLNAADVTVTNVDDEVAGVTLSPISGPTTEAGGTATFTVVLNTQPTANVTIALSSSNTNEGTVSPTSLTFTPTAGANAWNNPHVVTVTGVDDSVADGNVVYTIITAPAVSTDPKYNGLNAADMSVTNVDNETAGITVTPISGPTTEAGGTATFTVWLNTQPTANVTIGLSSSNTDEGTVSPTTLTFTPGAGPNQWSTPHVVTVTGVDDDVDDDNVVYTIITAPAVSTDPNYNNVNAADVTVTNVDDEVAGITVSPPTGPTTEAGGQAQFTVVLNSRPLANVTIALSSSNTNEGTVSPSSLTFTPTAGANAWNNPHLVTVTGVDDSIDDDNVVYTIVTAPAVSTDPKYSGLNAADVSITNIDDEPRPTITINDVTQNEGNSGSSTFGFTVSLSHASAFPITVGYATANGTATAGTDYTATSGTLTFNPGVTSRPVNVSVNGDNTYEPNETFTVNLSSPTNATIGDNQGVGTITNDDPVPSIAINDVTLNEGNSGTTSFQFTVSLSNPSYQTITVDYATANGSATAGTDYAAIPPTTLTFNPGVTSQTVTVSVNGDNTYEANETVTVNLSNAVNATIADNQGLGTITNDDPVPSIAINDVTLNEGNSGTTSFQFTVSLSNPSYQTITVNYATANGTAVAPGDYTAVGATLLSFAPGVTSQTVTVLVNGDTTDEFNETFFVNLSTPVNATIADNQGLGTITNDDTQPSIVINDVTLNEGNSGTTTFGFTVSLSAASGKTVTVNYATANGTAVAPGDYTAIGTTTLTFNPGVTSLPVNVSVNGDSTYEANETFFVNLSTPANATIADNQGLGTITNDDPVPSIAINDVTQNEGNSGTTSFQFTVSLSNPSYQTISVNYSTANGTAVAPGDYTAIGATLLSFAPGVTSQTVTVLVNGETTDEFDETFFVNLSTPTNATISDNQGLGTITNDDTPPSISINDVTLNEGNSGTTTFGFTVSLSAASGKTITVDYATANGTAVAPGDYTAIGTTTLTFNPGVTSLPVNVSVNGDNTYEQNETFTVDLSNAVNATILDNQGLGTITNDDSPPTISINDVTQNEGNSGSTNFQFTVSLSNPSYQTVTVAYATANGTATAGTDYTAITTTTLTFNPGVTSQTVNVSVNGDNTYEQNETLFVNLSTPTNATIADNQGLGTITNDDAQPTISINDVTLNEGNSGTTTFTFTVSLSNPSYQTIGVSYSTANGTATAGTDYTAIGSTPLSFAPGVTSQTVNVSVNGDNTYEQNETFFVNLSTPTNATIADNQGLGTITNDDAQPTISINDVTLNEGNSGSTTFTFTVSLSNPSYQTIGVSYSTANGTATAGTDYTAIGSTPLSFAPGTTSTTLNVSVNGDTTYELDENFGVNLSGPSNATIGDGAGLGTITNDDAQPTISINDVTQTEGNSGTSTFAFTVSLSNPSYQTITVDYATANGTATAGTDYTAIATTTLTFNPGVTSLPVNVAVNGDNTYETSETFFVNLTNPSNATIADNQGLGTITNDDLQPSITINDVSATEGNAPTKTFTFTVTLSNPSYQAITVDYATADGTATVVTDYLLASGTLTFNAGVTSQIINVAVVGDLVAEPNETFFVNLTNPSNATISDSQGLGTIMNDD